MSLQMSWKDLASTVSCMHECAGFLLPAVPFNFSSRIHQAKPHIIGLRRESDAWRVVLPFCRGVKTWMWPNFRMVQSYWNPNLDGPAHPKKIQRHGNNCDGEWTSIQRCRPFAKSAHAFFVDFLLLFAGTIPSSFCFPMIVMKDEYLIISEYM